LIRFLGSWPGFYWDFTALICRVSSAASADTNRRALATPNKLLSNIRPVKRFISRFDVCFVVIHLLRLVGILFLNLLIIVKKRTSLE
jgi:hypothetical protein